MWLTVETVDPVSRRLLTVLPCSITSVSVGLPNNPGGTCVEGPVVVDSHKPNGGPDP